MLPDNHWWHLDSSALPCDRALSAAYICQSFLHSAVNTLGCLTPHIPCRPPGLQLIAAPVMPVLEHMPQRLPAFLLIHPQALTCDV